MQSTLPLLLRGAAIGLVILTFVAPPPLRADNTADEAELRFHRGVAAYRARRFEDALAEFFHSYRLVHNRNVLHNIARSYEQLGQFDEAYRYYYEVFESYESEEDRAPIEASLARLASRVALLRVETNPRGADIFIGRQDLGSRGLSPKTLALPPGRTKVIVSMEGHREISQDARLRRGQLVTVDLPLEFIWGHVRMVGPPDGAEIRLDRGDGELLATHPDALQLRPGRHILHVSAKGYTPVQVPVEAVAEQETTLRVDLSPLPPPTGTLVVMANRDGALIRVGGRELGFTPAVLELPAGQHRVAVSMAEMRTFEEDVTLEDEGRAVIQADLRFVGAQTTAASKTETPLEEAPASITVISREELRAFGYSTLPEALRGVRGLFLSNDRTYEYLGVRGFSPPGDLNSRILVLYDGHTINEIYTGQAYIGRENSFDLDQIERIEIVRGPVSSLFGSAAFLGVINVVPREQEPGEIAHFSTAAGSLGMTRVRGSIGYRGDDLEASFSMGALTARGDEVFWLPAHDGLPEVPIRDRDGERAYGTDARFRYMDLTLLGRFTSRAKDVPTGAYYTLLDEHSMDMKDRRGFLEARWQPSLAHGGSLALRAFYDAVRYQGRFLDEQGEQSDAGEADWIGTELRYRSKEWYGQTFTAGIEFHSHFRVYQEVQYDDELEFEDQGSFQVASAYLVDELRLGKRLLVNASARLDHYMGSFGLTLNPRLALIGFTIPDGVTKLMGGRSFRAPTVYERFYEDGPLNPSTGVRDYRSTRANPNLGPEIIHTAELEHTQRFGEHVSLVGAVFVNRITDLITATYEDDDEIMSRTNAPGIVRTEGAEIELRWRPARMTLFSAAYWLQRMHVSDLDDDEEEARLRSNAPTHAFALRAMFPIADPVVIGSAEAIYNSPRLSYEGEPTQELFLLNAGLSGEISNRHRLTYFAGVQNLLDERAQLPVSEEVPRPTLPSIGRTFMLQVGMRY